MGIAYSTTFFNQHRHLQEEEDDDRMTSLYPFNGPIILKQWNKVLEIARSDIGTQEAKKWLDDWTEYRYFWYSPLGHACEYNAPFDVIETIFNLHPETIKVGGACFAINEAAAHHEDINVMKLLLQANPMEVAKAQDEHNYLPIHSLVDKNPHVTLDMVQLFLDAYPDSINVPCKVGFLPLHYACETCYSDINEDKQESIVMALLKANPETAQQRTRYDGYLPLHIAVLQVPPRIKVIKRLIQAYPEGLQVKDSKGRYPIHLFCGAKYRYDTRNPNDSLYNILPSEDHIINVMKVLLDANPESIIYTATSGRYISHRQNNPDGVTLRFEKEDEALYYPKDIVMINFGCTSFKKLLSFMKQYEQTYFLKLGKDAIKHADQQKKRGKKRKFSLMVGFNE